MGKTSSSPKPPHLSTKKYGVLMDSSSSYHFYIEWMLNVMVMVAGSGNNDQSKQADLLKLKLSPTYGCIVPGTKIKPEIWAILIVMTLVFALLVLADTLLRLFQYLQRKPIAGGDLAKNAPSSVEDWQLHLLQAMMPMETITVALMRNYSYSWDKDSEEYVLGRKEDSAAQATPSMDPKTYRSYSKLSKEFSL